MDYMWNEGILQRLPLEILLSIGSRPASKRIQITAVVKVWRGGL